MRDRIIQLTSELVAIPSHESEQIAQEHLARVLEATGFDCELQTIQRGRPNLIAHRGEGGTFLCSHVDTHPPHAHPEPFTARLRGEILVGRGVLDAKGQIAAAIAAAESEPEAPVTIVICCDEEFGGLGSEQLAPVPGPWKRDGGIVLEPTGFRVCTAQGGHIDLSIGASAPSTHAYAPASERSPIDVVVEAVDVLRTMSSLQARHPLLPAPRVHLGHLQGGEHLWRTPARAQAEVGIGLVPANDPEAVSAEIRERLDAIASSWDAEGGSFLYDIRDSSPAIELPADLPITARLASVLGANEPAGMSSWTDAANLWLRHGIPCVVFGAGELTSAHSNHEWIEADDLVRLGETLAAVLRTV